MAPYFASSPHPEPPTRASLAEARRELTAQQQSVQALSDRICAAEEELARTVAIAQSAIRELEKERDELQEHVAHTLAYVAPIRRLPHELLRYIFLLNFDEYPCCAWVLSAVSVLWRRQVLSMPMMWSKIRLVTTQSTSADTVRLWLERSGSTVPLDIEILLRSHPSSPGETPPRRRISPPAHSVSDWGWIPPPPTPTQGGLGGAATYIIQPPPNITLFQPPPTLGATAPIVQHGHGGATVHAHDDLWGMPPLVPAAASGSSEREKLSNHQRNKKNMHWGHIAFFYLVEQMHRWQRFVFRFEKQFTSVAALRAIEGECDAPLLEEFEVSAAEPAFYGDWKWLPSAPSSMAVDIGNLTSLTLNNVPFKWSSPMLRNLRSLSIRTLPTMHPALDRVMFMVTANPQLESLSLHFSSPNPPVLPLTPTVLRDLKSLTLGGHYLLSSLADALVLPSLEALVLDIDAREPIEDTVSALLARSNNPPLTRLSLSYTLCSGSSSFYYGGGAGVATWHFLSELDHLRTLQVGGAPFEPLLTALGATDDDAQVPSHMQAQAEHWVCPNLTTLALRGCHAHTDGVHKLVQMVEARNPDMQANATAAGLGLGPARLRHLELHDCATLGPDVLKWLKSRIEVVLCTEPAFEG
ncbi:uncharacterized protein B0H18DRAFT_876235 [Fomitopsis serialis]|uniref:uncharacterized protein n=1 Tax=Fomitopsis serialis TaxID=139415 RepID=UPI00200728F9|nr:uncharacterized protein B0H18DRAFT_876235 [Neoantrodia serialis]KAH9926712.1 hypothetical protein B0H18DRAFT_876235 [Neoantrodia serialis]